MKVTTTIYEIIQSEYWASGNDEFFNKDTNQLITQGDKNALINKIYKFDKDGDVYKICERYLFGEFDLTSPQADYYFKRMLITRFLNREIAFQTVDLFRNRMVSMLMANDQYLSNIYDNFYNIFSGGSSGTNSASGSNVYKDRSADATLPQDKTGVDLNDDTVPYADTTHYDNNKQDTTQNGRHDSVAFSASVLAQLDNIYNKKLNEFDAELFLQVW